MFNGRTVRFILRQNKKTGRVALYGVNQCSPSHVFADAAVAQAWLTKVGATCDRRVQHAGEGDNISGTYQYEWQAPQKGTENHES